MLMYKLKTIKKNFFLVLLIILSFTFIISWILLEIQKNVFSQADEGVSNLKHISSEIQRVVIFELEDTVNTPLILISDKMSFTLSHSTLLYKCLDEFPIVMRLLEDFQNEWSVFEDALLTFEQNSDRIALFTASENHYKNSRIITDQLDLYIVDLKYFMSMFKIFTLSQAILISLVLITIIFRTRSELYKNKELSKDMLVDISTGLYNREKCHELLKDSATPTSGKEKIIILFSLDDLNRNKNLINHRITDKKVPTFSSMLREVKKNLKCVDFAGRYEGNVFMISSSSADESDVKLCIDELTYLVDRFNCKDNKRFEISFTYGYAITGEHTNSFTMRDILNLAEKELDLNKLTKQEKSKQEIL